MNPIFIKHLSLFSNTSLRFISLSLFVFFAFAANSAHSSTTEKITIKVPANKALSYIGRRTADKFTTDNYRYSVSYFTRNVEITPEVQTGGVENWEERNSAMDSIAQELKKYKEQFNVKNLTIKFQNQ